MSSPDEMSDADIRQELRRLGVSEIGPINASTRGAYLKKIEKLHKASRSPGKNRSAYDGEKHKDAVSNAEKSPPKLQKSSRKSARVSRKPEKFGDSALSRNDLEEDAWLSPENDDENFVIPPSPTKKSHTTRPHPPLKPPPTSPIMDESAFNEKVLSNKLKNTGESSGGSSSKVPGQMNLNKSFDSISTTSKFIVSTTTTEINKSHKTRPDAAIIKPRLGLFTAWDQRPAKKAQPSPIYSQPSKESNSKWVANAQNKDETTGSLNAVEHFRSKLSDENLWLQKFSLDSNLASRRRTREVSKDSNVLAPEFQRPRVPVCGMKRPRNFWLNSTDALKNYGRSFAVNCSSLIGQIKGSLSRDDSLKAAGLNRASFKSRPTVDLHKFRQMNLRPGGRPDGVAGYRSAYKISWFRFDHECSKHILFALLFFLSLLAGAYFCTVYRERVRRGFESVYGAGVDTLDFVYRNMILPVLFVLLTVGTIYGIFAYKKYKWHKVAEEQRNIFEMVEEIIAILKKHHEDCLADGNRPPYLAVPHVRDMLIPPQRRAELYPIWDKAVEYLNENESRVRTENQCVSGEEFMVWRWLQAAHAASATAEKEDKIWQGHAFPAEEIQNNAPLYPYFECLKLRGLFDPEIETDEDWPEHVQDAILEKLGPNLRVIHLALDMQSKEGCVYMKLATKTEAGEAFKILNGSWFNGRLVSVKYLRPERYHQRFPDAQKAFIPLSVKKARNSINASLY